MKRIAAPMLGGLFTSFLMELLVYPAVYLLWRKRELEAVDSDVDDGGLFDDSRAAAVAGALLVATLSAAAVNPPDGRPAATALAFDGSTPFQHEGLS